MFYRFLIMKILAISDTHGLHEGIKIEKDIDCIIHAGDSTNYYDLVKNEVEFNNFIDWYAKLDVRYKVLIAGNHDAWSIKKYNRDKVKDLGIIYLEHEYCEIDNIMFFGSPYTPTFGTWHHMKDRSKLDKYWQMMETNIDVLITHGPPSGILDLSRDRNNVLEHCGDSALLKHVYRIKPHYHIFGHIHDFQDCINQGHFIRDGINFTNVSCVTDGRFKYGPSSHGIIFNITK